MSQSADVVRNGLVLRFSVPSAGELRAIATDLAVKVAEQLGVKTQEEVTVARAIDDLARRVAASNAAEAGQGLNPAETNAAEGFTSPDIAFEIHKLDRELKIEARSNGRASEARIPLPA